ncbi:unnamed protein product, partial [marine sediment metagenome]
QFGLGEIYRFNHIKSNEKFMDAFFVIYRRTYSFLASTIQ